MSLDGSHHPTKHLGRNNMYFVHEHQSPLPILDGLHNLRTLRRSAATIGYHGVCGDQKTSIRMNRILLVRSEARYAIFGDVGPQLELILPLQHRHGISTKTNDTLLDGLGGSDARQGLTGTTGQNNDSRSSTAVAKHLGQRPLLIAADASVRLEVHGQVGVDPVVAKVVLLHQRIVQLDGLPLDGFHHLSLHLEGHRRQRWGRRWLVDGPSLQIELLVIGIIVVGLTEHFEILVDLLGLAADHETVGVLFPGPTPAGGSGTDVFGYASPTDLGIPQQLPQHTGMLALHIKFVGLEHELGLAIALGALPNEGRHAVGQLILAQS
mmetsp:Transcript_23353/g.67314  ORF Transcript_23353/g.67314 Transcript_23353/m.67314 type:complete len:323 (+) Transcript_23353:1082-2050(+)